MRYGIFINQVMCVKWGIVGKMSNAAHVFAILHEAHAWAQEEIVGGRVFYWTSRNAICDELAYLQLKPDTVYRHLKFLHEKGLIEYIKIGRKDCIRITKEGKKWNSKEADSRPSKLGSKSEPRKQIRANSDLNPNKLGSKSENDSDLNPTDQSTSIDQKTKDQKTTHTVRAQEKNSLSPKIPKTQKKEKPAPREFSPQLIRYLETPEKPDFIWDAFDALIAACERKNLYVNFAGSFANEHIHHAMEIFDLLRIHKKIPQDGTGLVQHVTRFIDNLPQWYVDKFDLALIVRKFTKILNEQKNTNGNSTPSYRELAEKQARGERIFF